MQRNLLGFFLHYLTCSTTYPQNVEASAHYDVILRLNVFYHLSSTQYQNSVGAIAFSIQLIINKVYL